MVFHTFQYSVIVHCLCFPNWSGRLIGYTNIEETIQYSSFCNLVFINEIYLASLRKCAKIKIALSVQIEKCAKYCSANISQSTVCDNSDMKMNSACRAAVTNTNWNHRRGVIL